MINRSLYFLILLLAICMIVFCSSCKTAGIYTSNPKSKISFGGTEFQLTKNDSFYLRSWTDVFDKYYDEKGNQIFKEEYPYRGFGMYECDGDSLTLTFCNEDSITLMLIYEKRSIETQISFQIFDELGHPAYPSVYVLNDENEIIAATVFPGKDTFTFIIPNIENPRRLKLDGIGINIKNPIIELSSLSDGSYIIKRKTYNGYFAKGTEKRIWFQKRPTGIRYQLNDRKIYLPRKWKWNFFNRLYSDY